MTEHIISKQVFELDFPAGDVEEANMVYDKLTSIYGYSLIKTIDEVFSQCASDEEVIHIDSLVLTIPPVSIDNLEEDFRVGIRNALLEKLAPTSDKATAELIQENLDFRTVQRSELESLEFFLLHGYLPWWVSAEWNPEQSLINFVDTGSKQLTDLLFRIGEKFVVVQRLVFILDESRLKKLVRSLEPSHAEVIIQYAESLGKLHETKPVFNTSKDEFNRAKWELILSYILTSHGSVFNTKEFLRSNLGGIAKHFNISYKSLLKHYHEALSALTLSNHAVGLPDLIKAIYSEDLGSELSTETLTSKKVVQDPISVSIDTLDNLVRSPDRKKPSFMVLKKNDDILNEILLLEPLQVYDYLFEAMRDESLVEGLLRNFSKEQLHKMLLGAPSNLQDWWQRKINSHHLRAHKIPLFQHLMFFKDLDGPQLERYGWLLEEIVNEDPKWLSYFLTNHLNRELASRLRLISTKTTREKISNLLTRQKAPWFEGRPATEALDLWTSAKKHQGDQYDFFNYFVVHGSLPSMYQQLGQKALNRMFRDFFGRNPDLFSRLIKELRKTAKPALGLGKLYSKTLHQLTTHLDSDDRTWVDQNQGLKIGDEKVELTDSIQLLLEFLIQGVLSETRFLNMEEFFLNAVNESPDALVAAIESSGFVSTISDRITWYFSADTVDEFTKVVYQSDYLKAKDSVDSILELLIQLPGLKDKSWELEKLMVKWRIEWQLGRGGVRFEAGQFFKFVLTHVEGRFDFPKDSLLDRLQRTSIASFSLSNKSEIRLQGIMKDIYSTTDNQEQEKGNKYHQDLLLYLLKHGQPPWWHHSKNPESSWLEITELLQTNPELWRHALKQLSFGELERSPMFDKYGNDQLNAIVKVLAPALGEVDIYVEYIRRVENELLVNSSVFKSKRNIPWRVLIQYLLFEQSGVIHLRGLIESTIRQISRELSLSYEEVLSSFVSTTKLLGTSFSPIKRELRMIQKSRRTRQKEEPTDTSGKKKVVRALDWPIGLEMMHQFVVLGAIPAWAGMTEKELKDFFERQLIDKPGQIRAWLISGFSKPDQLAKFATLPKRLFGKVIKSVLGNEAAEYSRLESTFHGLWKNQFSGHLTGAKFSSLWRQVFIEYAIKSSVKNFNPLAFLNYFIIRLAKETQVSYVEILAGFRKGAIDLGESGNQKITVFLSILKNRITTGNQSKSKDESEDSETGESESEEVSELGRPIYIQNAGLVLLWSFLPQLFRNLGYLEDNKFISEQARHKALYLTQYLVTGRENEPEYQLVLNKLLLGVKTTKPILTDKSISEESKLMVKSLLESAIQHWEIIKDTSIEGFRASFLIRDGRLTETEDDWELVVESKAYDMLLDKLPWSINLIKLPWMEKTLYVKWR